MTIRVGRRSGRLAIFAILPIALLAQFPVSPGGRLGGDGGTTPRLSSARSQTRSLFITGQVFLEDGASISSLIAIVGACRGSMQLLGYTDMSGHFAIDAKPGSSVDDAAAPNSRGTAVCEVAARLEGYRSSTIDLTQHNSLENPNVGTILLHRIGDQEGSTVSVTSLKAPRNAKRAFDKGLEATRKNRLDEAQRQFRKAVELDPHYADAWSHLGHTQAQMNEPEAARASFAKAIAADPKFVPPYVELAGLDLNQGKWQQAAANSQRAIKLDPFSAPMVYFVDALANYSLHNWSAAERSARELEKLDPQHHYIKINRVLASILVARNDYAGAAEQMRDYLKFAGNAKDADDVRKQLAELEQKTAAVREP